MSYYDAEDYCRSFGAHLVSIHSEKENEFILKQMEEGGYGGRAWIGLNLFDGRNSPKWSDGSNVTYQKVLKKEYAKKEKCFMMFRAQRGWRPEHCALHYAPICKKEDSLVPTAIPPPTTLPPRSGYCPSGWIQFGQKCYKYFGATEKDGLKYAEARNACWNLGENHDLVSIHSMEEQAFLTQHLSDFGTTVWIGINKVESDEIGHDIVFGWVDNSRNDFSYWAKGHPPPGTWKYCGRLAYDGLYKGEWIADYCEIPKKGYICQTPSDPNIPKPTPEPSNCKPDFTQYRNSCYQYVSEPKTQEKAEETCKNLGGHLVSLVDALEQAFLYNLVISHSKSTFTGLESVQGTHYFRWTDKQPLYFANWANTEPQYISSNKSCVFMDHNGNFRWNATVCSLQMPFVCKVTNDVPPNIPVVLGICPAEDPDVIDIGDRYCYHVPMSHSHRILSWNTASRYCLTKGMKMVSLHSEHELRSLMAYLWRETYPVHLGLIRTFDKKSFMWADGSSFNYTNWADREPSSWSSDKDCVAFSPSDGKWTPISCSEAGIVLCRTDKKITK